MNLNLNTTSKLLEIRRVLSSISDTSFSFSTLNRQYPMAKIDESQATSLISSYLSLISEVKGVISKYEDENGGSNDEEE